MNFGRTAALAVFSFCAEANDANWRVASLASISGDKIPCSVPGVHCIQQNNSLFGSVGNLAASARHCWDIRAQNLTNPTNLTKFTVLFPVSSEFESRRVRL